MTKRTSFLTRCLSMLLVLAMLLSNVNMGFAMRASAAEFSVTAGKLVANNYELADAQEALLNSGYLANDWTVEYDVPKDAGLIEVDADNQTITVKGFGNWTAAKAEVVPADAAAAVEPVALTADNGNFVGSYVYDKNTFSVKAYYTLTANVDPAGMLNDIAALKSSYDNMVAVYDATSLNLGTVTMAMDALKSLRDGVSQSMGAVVFERQFGEAAGAVVDALEAEVAANGKLKLEIMNDAFDTDAVLAYLANNAGSYGAQAQVTYANLKTILDDPCMNDSLVDAILQSNDTAAYTQWMTLKGIIGKLVAALAPVNADVLTITDNVNGTVDYAALETLVKAVAEQATAPAAVLPVAETVVQANMSMFNVTITVQQMVVENAADSDKLVEGAKKTEVITVAEGAVKADVLAKATVIGAADAEWANYVPAVTTDITGAIAADCDYVVTYSPKTYKITYEYAAPETPAEVPYGYQLTLPKNADESKAYDYTVDGVAKEQGAVVTITGDTTIGRTTGKAYTTYNMFSILADNYANDDADKILLSGALKGDSQIKVRVPAAIDVLKLGYDKLSMAAVYASGYQGLSWAPVSSDVVTFVPGTYEYSTTADEATVTYRLDLPGDDSAVKTAVGLKAEAAAQKSTLDSFAGHYDTMGQLDKTKLGAINGAIDTSDFTPGDGEPDGKGGYYDDPSDAKNQELIAYFRGVVNNIIKNNVDKNNMLKIYNHMTGYKNNGLLYYYQNSTAMLNEIASLSQYLHEMLADDEKIAALSILVTNAGFPEYVDKIANLEEAVANVKRDLKAPNTMIDLNSASLPALLNLLQDGSLNPSTTGSGNPYLEAPLAVVDDSKSVVTVTVTANGVKTISKTYDIGAKPDVAALLAEAETFAKTQFNVADLKFYEIVAQLDDDKNPLPGKAELEALTKLEEKYYDFYIKYEPKTFTVNIPAAGGNAAQQITVSQKENTITLPAHNKAGFGIKYTVFGKVYEVKDTAQIVPLTDEQLLTLAENPITVEEWNFAEEELAKEEFKTLKPIMEAGKLVGYDAYVAPGKEGIKALGEDLLDLAAYISLNDEVMSTVDEASGNLLISMQTILNAMLDDKDFTSERVISLGNKGGLVFTGEMDLGYSEQDLFLEGLTFNFHLDGTAAQLKQGAGYLKAISPYMTFQSHPVANGESYLDIDVTLPEKAYEIYLTALLAEAEVSKDTIGDVNSEIAAMFMYDYLEIILDSDANTKTFTNTLAKLGIDRDLTGYEDYYQLIKSVLTDEGVVINTVENDKVFDAKVTAEGQSAIDKLLNLIKQEPTGEMATYLGMLKEYQSGNTLSMRAVANLTNTAPKMEALVLDLEAKGEGKLKTAANKFDYTENLSKRVKSITGDSAIILLNDVEGDIVLDGHTVLNINGKNVPLATIIDLNGHKVNGNIVANGGRVIIIDSMMDNANCGGANTVTGNATVLAGRYNTLDESVLKNGYVFEGGIVHNELFRYEGNNIVLNIEKAMSGGRDYLSTIPYMAAEIAADLALNYYPTASLSVGVGSSAVNTGLNAYEIYALAFDDMIDLIDSGTLKGTAAEVVDDVLACFNMPNVANFTNDLLDILVDVDSVEKVAKNGGVLGSLKLGIADWQVAVKHVTSGDYITAGLVPNYDTQRYVSRSLTIDPIENKTVLRALNELADIVEGPGKDTNIEITLNNLKRDGKTLIAGGGIDTSIFLNFCSDDGTDEDFTDHGYYNRMLAILVAYNDAQRTKDYIKNGEPVDIHELLKVTTVQNFFDAIEKAVNSDKPFDYMVEKVGAKLTKQEIAKLSKVYEKFQAGAGKILAKVEPKAAQAATYLSNHTDANGLMTLGTYVVGPRSADADYKGYGVQFDLLQSSFLLKVQFCTEDGYKLVFVNHDDKAADATVKAGKSFYIMDKATVLQKDNLVELDKDSYAAMVKQLDLAGGDLAITYTYDYDTAGGVTMQKPEHMYVWHITKAGDKVLEATRVKALDDVLKYVGNSIWLSGKNVNGLRYHYDLNETGVKELENLGYSVKQINPEDRIRTGDEHGVVIDWKYVDKVGALNPNKGVIRENIMDDRDENRDKINPATELHWNERYHNAWPGNELADHYASAFKPADDPFLIADQNARFYLALERDGVEYILYSGVLERDILFVAEQLKKDDAGTADNLVGYIPKVIERAEKYAATEDGSKIIAAEKANASATN